jgi:UDP-N-acetylglucosamine acyltransferase
MPVHPHAAVSPHAVIGQNVDIGPFCVVEDGVQIGDDCRLASHCAIKSGTTLGKGNVIGEGAVLGGVPQHAHPPALPGKLIVGHHNTIREFATLHRAMYTDRATIIGDHNLIMVGVHVGHDCVIGNHVIVTNNAALAGHVQIDDRAYLSCGVGVHQFCRIGRFAMLGGHARVVQDILPYITVDGGTSLAVGLNVIGLRRNGYTTEQISELKRAYRVIYRSGLTWREVVPALMEQFPAGPAAEFHRFLSGGTRGFVQERRTPPGATVRLMREPDDGEVQQPQYKVG